MDRTLISLLVISLLLIAWQAPYAVLTLVGIVALSIASVRGAWGVVQGWNDTIPEPQRVSTD